MKVSRSPNALEMLGHKSMGTTAEPEAMVYGKGIEFKDKTSLGLK